MKLRGDVLTLSKEDIVEGLLSDYTLCIPSGARRLRLETEAQHELTAELDNLAGEKTTRMNHERFEAMRRRHMLTGALPRGEGGVSKLFAAGTAWSQQELDSLAARWNARMLLFDICLLRGRTASAVVAKMVLLGLLVAHGDGAYYRVSSDPEFHYSEMYAVDQTMREAEQ